nr:fructose-specific PTS transporter subunit EIIC [Bacillus licheniformis]
MQYVVNTPVKYIMDGMTHWLEGLGTGNLVVMGIVLGGMMAIDMGGPINKAAFTFGIAMIEAGNFGPHATIMAGGMVPPLGIALATTFFKNKFSKRDREAGITNYVMGLSFITEGAIPFAYKEIRHASFLLVSSGQQLPAVCLNFSMSHCKRRMAEYSFSSLRRIMRPLYLLSILIGAVVTALILGVLKKPVPTEK